MNEIEYDYDIGVIGGGAAGLSVAAGSAQFGMKTVLCENEPLLGGDCLHFGCVPSKALINSASIYHQMQQGKRFGLPIVIPDPVDFSQLSAHIQSIIQSIQKHDSHERFTGLGVNLKTGRAQFLDENSVVCGEEKISAKYWVIATGASAQIPPISGIEDVPYLTNKELFNLSKLPSSLLILGAGAISCEMAQAFQRLGSQVTVLQRSSQILRHEDVDMSDIIKHSLELEGVTLTLGCTFSHIEKIKTGVRIYYEQNGEMHQVEGEQLLVATGRKPSLEGLSLDRAGVEFSARGITVDSRLRTSQKHIFAAGDVLGVHQFTHAAGYEAGVVLTNIALRLPRKVSYKWMPRSMYTSPELVGVGLTEKEAQEQGISYTIWEEFFADNDRGVATGNTTGKIKLVLDKRFGRKEKILGVHIVGEHAGEILSSWISLLQSKGSLSTMASTIQPYPTLGEINKRVAGKVLSKKIFSPSVQKILRFLFKYRGD